MAQKNTNLHNAKKARNDEFYTQLSDIEKEMAHYKDFFKGKIVYCNCDDARESNFFKFFSNNFESLGLKKLITTGYKENGKGVKLVYEGDKNGNFMVDDAEVVVTELEGNGDFRSEECIELLKECDVVVTNPPFSLFREYVAQLMEYGKKFIILGNMNAITYKEIFPYIKNNELWWGCSLHGTKCHFIVPNAYEGTNVFEENGVVNNAIWFTNINHTKRNTPLDLYKKYSADEYPKYDNYNAIEVSKVSEIPTDYEGVMGVPITFLDKYCPTQFEIIALGNSRENFTPTKDYVNPIKVLKNGNTMNGNAINCVLAIARETQPFNEIYYTSDNAKYLVAPYARILIRRKKAEPIVEVETTDNVSVNEVEQNDVQPSNNVEVAKDNTTSNEVHTPTRRLHSDEDVYIDSITIENGTEIANKHNTRRGIKNKTINLNNSTNDIADKNLPP